MSVRRIFCARLHATLANYYNGTKKDLSMNINGRWMVASYSLYESPPFAMNQRPCISQGNFPGLPLAVDI